MFSTRSPSALSVLCSNSTFIRIRCKTSTASQRRALAYPYPAHENPTPHQIFHLPNNASQDAIKSRYYELVKIYHPDTSGGRSLAQETAEARFQAITKAYDFLRKGKSKALPAKSMHDLQSTTTDRRRELMNRAELNIGLDERGKGRLMVGALVVSIIVFVYQMLDTRRQGLAAALENSRHRRQRSNDPETGSAATAGQHRKTTIQNEEYLALSDTRE